MYHSLSQKAKDRIFDRGLKSKCFHKLRFHSVMSLLFKTYKSSLSDLNIRQIRKQNYGEEHFMKYNNPVIFKTLETTLELVTKLAITKHGEDGEVVLCPCLKGSEILRAYVYIACSKKIMSSEYKKQFVLAGDMMASTTKLLFAFDSIVSHMLAHKLDIYKVPSKFTDLFWERVSEFHRDYHIFAYHDKFSMVYFNKEKFRFLATEAIHLKDWGGESQAAKLIMSEYGSAADYLTSDVFMEAREKRMIVFENMSLRFLHAYFRNSAWIQPSTLQNLSFKSLLVLKKHLWKKGETPDVEYSTYKSMNIFDLDWDFENVLYQISLDPGFTLTDRYQRDLFFEFSTCCDKCFQQCGVSLNFEHDMESRVTVKKGLFFACVRIFSVFKRMETMFRVYQSHMEEDERSLRIEGTLRDFRDLCACLHFRTLLTGNERNFGAFVEGFAAEMTKFVKILASFQELVKLWDASLGSDLDIQFLGGDQKDFMALVPPMLDSLGLHALELYHAVCCILVQMVKGVKSEAFGENTDEVVEYLRNDMHSYIEQFGEDLVLVNTRTCIQKMKTHKLEASNAGLHHLMVTDLIMNPPALNKWPETLWRSMHAVTEIRRELDMYFRMLWCKELFKQGQILVHVDMEKVEEALLQIEPKNNQEETNMSIYEVFRANLTQEGWGAMKVALQKDTSDIYHSTVRVLTRFVFGNFEFSPSTFLVPKLSVLRAKFIAIRDFDWKIHGVWYDAMM